MSASFDRDATAREAMVALIALHDLDAFDGERSDAVIGISCAAYQLADAMAKARGDRSSNVAQAEAVVLLPAPAESVVAGPPSPVVVCTHDDIPWTAEMIETFAQFRLELWKERSGEAGYWLAERGEASGAAFARFDAAARPLAGARLDEDVLSLPPQVVARAEELIRAEKAKAGL